MEIVEIYPPYLYSIKYDEEEENEYDRLFRQWNNLEYVVQFMMDNKNFLSNSIWRRIIEPERMPRDKFLMKQMVWKICSTKYVKVWTMAFNMEKMAEIAKPRSEEAKKQAQQRRENRDWLRLSQDIALSVHYYLRNSGMTQKELADKMGVSAPYIGKLLKGSENLTLETICKIQNVIGEEILSLSHPYISRQVLILSWPTKFSNNTVQSDAYRLCVCS